MSYDLYLIARDGLDSAAFNTHFGGRNRYSLQNGQAWYENEDTGVYFSFELPDEDVEEPDDDLPDHAFAFNLNLCRPTFFALEAAIELKRVTDELALDVFDPQSSSTRCSFRDDAFVGSWAQSNHKATTALLRAQPDMNLDYLPRSTLESAWKWNYGRAVLQARLGDDVFVPRIMFVRWRGNPATATVWTDAIPVIFPRTDLVLVYRESLAPRRLLRRKSGAVPVPWYDVDRALRPFASETSDSGDGTLFYRDQEPAVSWFVTQLRESADQIEGISMDHLTDTENAS